MNILSEYVKYLQEDRKEAMAAGVGGGLGAVAGWKAGSRYYNIGVGMARPGRGTGALLGIVGGNYAGKKAYQAWKKHKQNKNKDKKLNAR